MLDHNQPPAMRVLSSFRPTRFAALALLAAWAGRAGAQNGTVRGVIKDTTGIVLKEAEVRVLALDQLTRSDDSGRFILTKLPRGQHELTVPKLGYSPERVTVTVNDTAYSYEIELVPQA